VVRRSPARALRGAAAGLLTTFLALLFHVLGGGAVPPSGAVALFALASVWISVLIGRRRPSLPLLVLAVAASQLVLHTAFQMTTGAAEALGADRHAGHDGGVVILVAHGGHAMWLAHLVAGALTIAAIHRGEAVLRRIAELVGIVARAVALLGPPPAPGRRSPRPCPAPPAARALSARPFGSVVVRRGPPVVAG